MDRCYVWFVPPGVTAPVPYGLMQAATNGRWRFAYGRRYAARSDAISIAPDFPLDGASRNAWLDPLPGDALPAPIADVGPGRWADHLLQKRLGRPPTPIEGLLASGPARLGALAFSETRDTPPDTGASGVLPLAQLPALAESVARIETADEIPAAYRFALAHGPSVGGRRPKADFIDEHGQLWIAKLPSRLDTVPDYPRLEAFGLAACRT